MVARLIEWFLNLFDDPADRTEFRYDPSAGKEDMEALLSAKEFVPVSDIATVPLMITAPPWLDIALGELNVQEVSGEAHNPRILEYHGETTLRAQTDEIPWCSAFVCWVVEQAGIPSTKSASARSWTGWGDACEPFKGAITVLSRGSDPKKGHVGFYMGEEGDHILLLGGNQGNEVNISSYAKSRVVTYRSCQWDA